MAYLNPPCPPLEKWGRNGGFYQLAQAKACGYIQGSD